MRGHRQSSVVELAMQFLGSVGGSVGCRLQSYGVVLCPCAADVHRFSDQAVQCTGVPVDIQAFRRLHRDNGPIYSATTRLPASWLELGGLVASKTCSELVLRNPVAARRLPTLARIYVGGSGLILGRFLDGMTLQHSVRFCVMP
ncbi:hypothetical protein EJ02DRAFT_73966 [Clathrospora elynae]|uniref:Uncharacterized protein n=1 Tax=Clathrospora elynae TaxID=706981 RepID=A0A6A5SBD6_9PLEO|nr:hypothetical protein EJ02DRAFT_73966 [Clathrospora elynae]